MSGVYKMAAIQDETGAWVPKRKFSDAVEKSTLPDVKQVFRLFGEDGYMMADLIEKEAAPPDATQPIWGHHPYLVGVRKRYETIAGIESLLQPVLRDGVCVAAQPALPEIRARCRELLKRLHPTSRRLLNPHVYKVSVGPALYELAERLREEAFPGP